MKIFKKLLSLSSLSLLFFSLSIGSFAQSPIITFSENSNSGFKYTATPGSSIIDSMTITNKDNSRSVTVKPSLLLIEDWVTIHPKTIELLPNESKVASISINIPEDVELKKYTGTLQVVLDTWDGKESGNGSVGIGIGIGRNFQIEVMEGEAVYKDYQKNITQEKKILENNDTNTSNISLKTIGTYIYTFTDQNLKIILLIVIIALFLKLIISSRKEEEIIETKTKASTKKVTKTPAKKSTKAKASTKKVSKTPAKKSTKAKTSTKKVSKTPAKKATKAKASTKKASKAPAKKSTKAKASTKKASKAPAKKATKAKASTKKASKAPAKKATKAKASTKKLNKAPAKKATKAKASTKKVK